MEITRWTIMFLNMPHSAEEVTSDRWEHPYSREKAVYPLKYLKNQSIGCPCPELIMFTVTEILCALVLQLKILSNSIFWASLISPASCN